MNDLTAAEQANVRKALNFLRAYLGSWSHVYAALDVRKGTLIRARKDGAVTASIAFRAARIIGVGVDAVLAGKYAPPGVCPHCAKPLAD